MRVPEILGATFKILNMKYRELNQDETSILFSLLTTKDKAGIENLFKELSKQGGGWVLAAIEKRFSVHQISCDKKVMIMILTMGDGVVGRCARYVDDIVKWCRLKESTNITLDDFCNKIYPMEIPVF